MAKETRNIITNLVLALPCIYIFSDSIALQVLGAFYACTYFNSLYTFIKKAKQ